MKFLSLTILVTLIFCSLAAIHVEAQGVTVSDNFESSSVGQPPGLPLVGSRDFYGAGQHTVITSDGSQRLESIDSLASDGFAIQWYSNTSHPITFKVSYLFRIASSSGGVQASHQSIALLAPGFSVDLVWRNDGDLEVKLGPVITTVGSWMLQTTYDVAFAVDCSSDTYSLSVDGTNLVTSGSLGYDCTGFSSFANSTPFDSLTTTVIDDVLVTFETPPLFEDDFESGDTTAWNAPSGPIGDQCTSAPILGSGTVSGSLANHTASGVTDTCGSNNTIDAWYEYVAPCDGLAEVHTCLPGTEFDTVLSAWDGCPAIGEVACNDDAQGAPPECDLNGLTRKSRAVFSVDAGSSYFFRVSGFADDFSLGSDFDIAVTCTTL
ncbi:MAG: hypothetical protein K8J08_13640 [Thermoanaerobaculia bacterium]|nr:hypothetical protein [Thermoanaerobaculia bacterium]